MIIEPEGYIEPIDVVAELNMILAAEIDRQILEQLFSQNQCY